MISLKHSAFIDALFKFNFDRVKAYKSVYQGVTDETATVNSSKLLSNANIKEEIDQRKSALASKNIISKEEVLHHLKDILENNKDVSPKDSLKAIDLLTKMLGFNEPSKTEITIKEQPLFGPENSDDSNDNEDLETL